jgi:hypothetical protein
MLIKSQIRIPLRKYFLKHEKSPVYHMFIADNSFGLQITARLVDMTFDKCLVHYQKPNELRKDELPGVYISKIDTPKDVLAIFILTLDRNLEVISNDEYAAKDLFVRLLFTSREAFNSRVEDLTICDEWTEDQRIKTPFISELESQLPMEHPTNAN